MKSPYIAQVLNSPNFVQRFFHLSEQVMNKLITISALILLAACMPSSDKTKTLSDIKVPVYAWMGGPGHDTDKEA